MAFGNKINELHQIKYDLFKAQDPATGRYDVTFEVEGKLLYAHKNMLNLVSDTFDSMLSDRWIADKDQPVKIKDYSYDDFYLLLTFLYSAQCELNEANIYAMVDMAEYYGVDLFKEYCDEYLSTMAITIDNIFKLVELADKYTMNQLKATTREYISSNFHSFADSEGFMIAKKLILEEMVITAKDLVKPEDLFCAIYKWCEKQAMDKQADVPNLNLNDTIKAEIVNFLPNIRFNKMYLNFLHTVVVPKGFIFSSLEELSKILSDCHHSTKVIVTNERGQVLHGNVIPEKALIEFIKSLNSVKNLYSGTGLMYCWWQKTNCKFQSAPTLLKKKEGIDWYLVCSRYGDIGVQHSSVLHPDNYILAEMTAGTSGFQMTNGCKIVIE